MHHCRINWQSAGASLSRAVSQHAKKKEKKKEKTTATKQTNKQTKTKQTKKSPHKRIRTEIRKRSFTPSQPRRSYQGDWRLEAVFIKTPWRTTRLHDYSPNPTSADRALLCPLLIYPQFTLFCKLLLFVFYTVVRMWTYWWFTILYKHFPLFVLRIIT